MSDQPLSEQEYLDDFLSAYKQNDNEWWLLGSGEHQNLFDAALSRISALERIQSGLEATGCLCHCERDSDGNWRRVRRCPRCEILEGDEDEA